MILLCLLLQLSGLICANRLHLQQFHYIPESSISNNICDNQQHLLYTNICTMDDPSTASQKLQTRSLLSHRGTIFPLATIYCGDVVVDSWL